MTYLDKLMREHPELISTSDFATGAFGCPSDYGYMTKEQQEEYCKACYDCPACWAMEVPGTASFPTKPGTCPYAELGIDPNALPGGAVAYCDTLDVCHSCDKSDLCYESDVVLRQPYKCKMPEESNNGSNAPIHFNEFIPDPDPIRLESYTNTAMRYRHNGLAHDLQLFHGALGLAGESGEVCDLIKKYAFQGHPLEEDKLVEELGDTLWYLAHIASTIGIPLAEIMDRNIAKLVARYPNGHFEVDRSINREV